MENVDPGELAMCSNDGKIAYLSPDETPSRGACFVFGIAD